MPSAKSFRRVIFVPAAFFLLFLPTFAQPADAQQGVADDGRFMIAAKFTKEEMDKAKDMMNKILKKEGKADGSGDGGDGSSGDASSSGTGDSSDSSGSTGSSDSSDSSDTSGSSGSTGSSSSTGSSTGGTTGSMGSIDSQPMPEPGPSVKKTDPNDLMFAQAHMKLAKRAFAGKNIEKAKTEIDQVLERVSEYPEARFMKAVIAAKEKNFIEAWRNIEVAQKGAPDNQKIKDFVDRLEKAFPKPNVLPDSAPAARPAPTYASELAVDAIEKLFSEKCAAGKLSAVELSSFAEKDGSTVAQLKLECTVALDAGEVRTAIKTFLGGTVGEPKTASAGQTLEFEIQLPKLPAKNPKAQAVSGLGEFMKGISEETDVAIQNTAEKNSDDNKQVTGDYTFAAKDIKNLNDFLHKLSPYAIEFTVNRFYSTVFAGKPIWKAEVKIVFLVGG